MYLNSAKVISIATLCIVAVMVTSSVPGEHSYYGIHSGFESPRQLLDEWTVQVEGGEQVAQLIALEHGFVFGGQIQGFSNTYIFRAYGHNKQRRTPGHVTSLANDKRIHWAEQLFVKSRVKRYPLQDSDQELLRVKRVKGDDDSFIEWTPKRKGPFNDELWQYQWYLDTSNNNRWGGLDLNVLPVYRMGYDGRGVRVSVLDDGIEHNHTDLQANYDPEISWDSNDRDPDPFPRLENLEGNSHGTRCAGEIAMSANNLKCGVGVAYGASVGGVRMLDGHISDRVEGEAIGYAWDKVDIYSASWGPNDDGRTVEGPGRLAIEALRRGITEGRNGKGIIYVWANGNGGRYGDNCNCDGYSSSIYTISVASASQHGLFPWYGEVCSSTLATAFSSGGYQDLKIATTDVNNSCTLKHSGTSAAAPLAAGIIALVLQANPDLTWRDIQHLIVRTSEYAPLSNNHGWQINDAGLRFNVRFGFGLMNAAALVQTALGWSNVPEKMICNYKTLPNERDRQMASGVILDILLRVDECPVNYIEHVELLFNAKYSRRGALKLYLTSPQGTNVQLLSQRIRDTASSGFDNWPFTSVATWGENPHGIWRLSVVDQTMEQNTGEIGVVTLVVHGTKNIPNHMSNGPRKYNNDFINNLQDELYNNEIEDQDINVPKSEAYDTIDNEYENVLAFEEEWLRKHHSCLLMLP